MRDSIRNSDWDAKMKAKTRTGMFALDVIKTMGFEFIVISYIDFEISDATVRENTSMPRFTNLSPIAQKFLHPYYLLLIIYRPGLMLKLARLAAQHHRT